MMGESLFKVDSRKQWEEKRATANIISFSEYVCVCIYIFTHCFLKKFCLRKLESEVSEMEIMEGCICCKRQGLRGGFTISALLTFGAR